MRRQRKIEVKCTESATYSCELGDKKIVNGEPINLGR